jgi:hypothetical protein
MLFFILLLSVLVVAAFALLLVKLWRRSRVPGGDPLDWLDQFSVANYQPMERLLDHQDYRFLASQPGYRPSIASRLRRQRIGIFQTYLGGMIRDFHRLLKAARFIVVYSPNDQSAFAATLWRLRLRFYGSIFGVEARVLLYAIGIGRVDARGLLATLERMQGYTRQLIPQFEAV